MSRIAKPFVAVLAVALAGIAPAVCHAQVSASDAWVRGTVPGQKATGAFMVLRSEVPATLVGAGSDVTASTEVHEMSMVDGIMRMREVARVPLEAGKPLKLEPGGFHVMLLGLDKAVEPGATVRLQLRFELSGGGTQTLDVDAPVLPLTARGPGAGQGGQPHGHGAAHGGQSQGHGAAHGGQQHGHGHGGQPPTSGRTN